MGGPDGIISAKLVMSIRSHQREPPMAKMSMVGLNLAKNVFGERETNGTRIVC